MKARLVILSLLATAACGADEEALDPAEASAAAEANLRQMAGSVSEALAFLLDTRPGCEPDEACWLDEADAGIDQVAAALGERILDERNLESVTPRGALIYRLDPEVVCDAGDASCASLLESVEVRLRAVSHGPGEVDLLLLLGPDRLAPLELFLHPERLEVQVELAALRRALPLLGVEEDELPALMVGRLSFALSRHGEQELTASLSVLEALALAGGALDDLRIEMGVALPAVSVHVLGQERHLAVTWGRLPRAVAEALEEDLEVEDDELDVQTLQDGGCLLIDGSRSDEPVPEVHAGAC